MGIFGCDFKGHIFGELRGTALHIWRFIFSFDVFVVASRIAYDHATAATSIFTAFSR